MLVLNKKEAKIMSSIFKELSIILLGAFFLAKILAMSLWQNYLVLCHTGIEAVCIFISFSIFLLAWYAYDNNRKVNFLICFVFFIVGILDLLHLRFYSQETLYFQSNLSVWYWLLGRFFLAFMLVFITADLKLQINKYIGLFLSLLLVSFMAMIIYQYEQFLPVLFSSEGYTSIKRSIDCVLIGLFLISLYNLRDRIDRKDVLAYRYLISAVLVGILMVICYMVNSLTFFYNIMGHLLKMTCYYFFFKGIFVCVANYPYKEIEAKSRSTTQIFDEIPLGIVIYDQYFRLYLANKKALKLLTCRLRDICGLHHDEIVQKLGFINAIEKIGYNRGVIKNIYLNLKDQQGMKHKIKADYYKLSDSYLVLFEEVKEKQELETLRSQMKIILDSINKAILLLDIDNKIIMCNKRSLDLLEMEEKEFMGKSIRELAALLQVNVKESLEGFKQKKKAKELHEITIVTANNHKKNLLFHIDLIKNIEEDIIGAVFLATDITLFKKESLKMQQKEKLIAIGQMTAGIVHEIKNPLTAIKGFSELIKYKVADNKILEYACAIEQETDVIDNLINDLLMHAKPSPPVFGQANLNKIVESLKLLLDSTILLKGIKVSFALTPEEKIIRVDVKQLRQVLLNIIKNAIEAVTESGGSEVKISTNYHKVTKEMSVSVFNDGRAMTEEEKMMAGTPFFTTKEKGTGLGLSICFQIIKEHNGRIEIESEEGQGTRFIVYLPCTT